MTKPDVEGLISRLDRLSEALSNLFNGMKDREAAMLVSQASATLELAKEAIEITLTQLLKDRETLRDVGERAVRIAVWNFLRERGVKDDACYPIIEGAATSYRADLEALNTGNGGDGAGK